MAEPVYPSLEEEPKKGGSEQSEEIRLLTSEEQRRQVSQTALLCKNIPVCIYKAYHPLGNFVESNMLYATKLPSGY